MRMRKPTKVELCTATLRKMYEDSGGDYVVHVKRGRRHTDVVIQAVVKGELHNLAPDLATVRRMRTTKDGSAVCVGGSGFDPRKHLVDQLKWTLEVETLKVELS